MQATSKSGIVWTDGILTLTNAKGGPVQIKEMPMDNFEQFYRLWHSAIASSITDKGNQTFVQAWSRNAKFRSAATQALQIAGVENPGLLTPRQLEELFLTAITDENGIDTLSSGLLFRLHYQAPGKVDKDQEAEAEAKKPKKSFLSLISLGIQRVGLSVIPALLNFGL